MMETAEALAEADEHAIDSELVGVYVGCIYQEYSAVLMACGQKPSPQSIVGNGDSFLVGRLSFSFGFSGPCISMDTACSSSLVATHLAHMGLLHHECSAAVAAGTNIMLSASTSVSLCQLQVRHTLLFKHHYRNQFSLNLTVCRCMGPSDSTVVAHTGWAHRFSANCG